MASLVIVDPRIVTGVAPWARTDASTRHSARASHSPSGAPAGAVAVAPAFTAVPTACEIVSRTTLRDLVPVARPTVASAGGSAASTCNTYAMLPGGDFRSVQVAVQAFMIATAVQTATTSFDAQVRQAQGGGAYLQRLSGLGDAAFERYWVDSGARNATGEAVVRDRNVVLTVDYTEQAPTAAGRPASEVRCLSDARLAARAALASL